MIAVPNENTFRLALLEGVNLFLGAGFSVHAKDLDDQPLPGGPELATELIKEFELPSDYAQLDLPRLVTILEHDRRQELNKYLRTRFTVGWYDPVYQNIDRIRAKALFTTNVDDLLYKIYSSSKRFYLNDLDIKGPAFKDRTAVDVVALHGNVQDSSRPLTFGTLDTAAAFNSDPDRWHFLTQMLQKHPTLFWGYGMGDGGTLTALNPRTVRDRPHQAKWIILRPQSATEAAIHYFTALGLQVIVSETHDFLAYLASIEPRETTALREPARARTRDIFPQDAIPDVGTVPVRSILDFYTGAAPSWYDIFSGKIHKTEYFASLTNAILSGQHVIVTGLAGCGKTTVMMQVAAGVVFPGHKLVCEQLSEEKARFIANRLAGSKALVFIDNFADSIGAFNLLSHTPNIQVVGCERDYNYDIVSHKIDSPSTLWLDVTEISSADIQEILSRIPRDIIARNAGKLSMAEGSSPSLFEIIEHNVARPMLQTRYVAVMNQLVAEDIRLLEFLLATCYVHKCRTPVSMDMLFAYFGDGVEGYDEIIMLRDRLGAMLHDYAGGFVDEDQDYYVARSTLLAEAVIEQAQGNHLRHMLLRFHENVRPYRIARYHVFRMRAYDASLMVKAFPHWQDGLAFYESVNQDDPSPYFLQQGALYLSKKRQHTLAFQWIDAALVESGNRIMSIRNSHAIILFRANIDRQDADGNVDRTLRQSMTILSECYEYDKRKTYHALTFADQAVQYDDKYHNDVASEYLARAKEWLQRELTEKPWFSKRIMPLLRRVTKRIESEHS